MEADVAHDGVIAQDAKQVIGCKKAQVGHVVNDGLDPSALAMAGDYP